MSETTTDTRPEFDMVVLHLGRRMYENFCSHKKWEPFPFPYVDGGSLRSARIAVDYLGYDDDVLEGEAQ